MVSAKVCVSTHADGRPCGAPPLLSLSQCFWHAPDKADEAAEARRLGGLRRRKEKTVSAAYDIAGLGSVGDMRRVLEIATIDTLGLENSVARNRVLLAAVTVGARLLEAEQLASFGFEPDAEE